MKFSRVFPGISAMLVLCAASLSAASPVAVQQLRCEYRVEPMELDAARPRLSWIVTSAQRGQKQTAYQILAAANRSTLGRNRGELWDSGRVVSDETAHIVYNGRPLSSHQSVWWKVRTWNQNGQASTWSAPASWTTGLVNSPRRQAAGLALPTLMFPSAERNRPVDTSGEEAAVWRLRSGPLQTECNTPLTCTEPCGSPAICSLVASPEAQPCSATCFGREAVALF